MKYDILGVMIGKKCNAACKICCISANEECEDRIDMNLIKRYISSSKYVKSIRSISFSGGEIFLYYDELKELIKLSSEIGKISSVVTNGFWATSLDKTKEKLLELKELGLSAISVSYDEYHAKYIGSENIRNILRVAKSISMPVSLQTVMLKNSVNKKWLEEISDDLADVSIDFVPCFPVGNAKKFIDESQFIRNKSASGSYCRKNGAYSVSYDGSVWPCCSPYVVETELSVGNINYDIKDVETTLSRVHKNLILNMLRNHGFDYFIDIAKNQLNLDVPDKIISSCELCALFFCKENIYKFIPYIYKSKMMKNKK